MTNQEINFAAIYIASIAKEENAVEKVNIAIQSLLSSYDMEAKVSTAKNGNFTPTTSIITFTQKEVSKMDSKFKKILIANGLVAKVRIRKSGYYQTTYEIRFRSHGYSFSCTAKTIDKLKAEFLRKTSPGELEKYKVNASKQNKHRKDVLHIYFDEWLSLKRGNIGEKEIKRFQTNFNNLPENLRYTPIRDIRAVDLNAILQDVQPRKYEELRTLFNGIFKYAMASGVIQTNPVALIKFKRAERQNREALSKDEVKSFLERVKDTKYDSIRQFAYVLYFFGLRPCEVDQETRREDNFLITRNRKRKNGKIEYKKIPVPKQAQGLIDWDKPLVFNCSDWKRDKLFKKLLGDGERTAYCLRHTFSTVCQEYLKRPDIVDIWMGDSPQRLVGKVYTHFSDKFMRSQMDMVVFPTLESLET